MGGHNVFCTFHHDAGVKKPSSKLFDLALGNSRGGQLLDKSSTVYVDDVKRYTDAAKEYGLQTVYVDHSQLDYQRRCISELAQLGFHFKKM